MSFLPTYHPVKYGSPKATSGLIERGGKRALNESQDTWVPSGSPGSWLLCLLPTHCPSQSYGVLVRKMKGPGKVVLQLGCSLESHKGLSEVGDAP